MWYAVLNLLGGDIMVEGIYTRIRSKRDMYVVSVCSANENTLSSHYTHVYVSVHTYGDSSVSTGVCVYL